jgi:hypothetical protein
MAPLRDIVVAFSSRCASRSLDAPSGSPVANDFPVDRSRRDRCAGGLVAVLATAFPLARLWPLNGQFYLDWTNHKWLAAFAGEYLRQHGTTPAVLNTIQQAGMPYPVFYGTLFDQVLSLVTAWSSPDLALRLVVVAVTALQFVLVARALVGGGLPRWSARAVACLVIWAIYPLTNLYHRAAIPEFVATGLLTCAVALWFLLVQAPTTALRRRRATDLGLVFALIAGTHPITALYSVSVVALLLGMTLVERRRDRAFCACLLESLWLPAVLVTLSVVPWLYALAKFEQQLQITHELDMTFYAGIDEWATRFAPLPWDPRTKGVALDQVTSPYLDAQIDVALGALAVGWLVVVARRDRATARAALRSLAPVVVAFGAFTWLAVCPSAYAVLPSIAKKIQFAYRAITYQNLALLLALFSLLSALERRDAQALVTRGRAPAAILMAALALAATGVGVKLVHASRTMTVAGSTLLRADDAERRRWTTLPSEFYGALAYATPSLYRALGADEHASGLAAVIPIGTDADFGDVKPLRFEAPVTDWYTTNVQAFPWNTLVVDGAVVPAVALRVANARFVVQLAPGQHLVELRTVPTPAWLFARTISFSVVLLWLGWVLLGRLAGLFSGAAPAPAPALEPRES